MEVDNNKEQLMETDGIIEQIVLPEEEILETSEHDKELKNERQNMTPQDNCKWSEYSEVLERSDSHPSETPKVVNTNTVTEIDEPAADATLKVKDINSGTGTEMAQAPVLEISERHGSGLREARDLVQIQDPGHPVAQIQVPGHPAARVQDLGHHAVQGHDTDDQAANNTPAIPSTTVCHGRPNRP